MPGIDFLRLQDARDDSPQARSMLGLFEEDAALFMNYVNGLHVVCRKVVECENALSLAVQAVSKKLKDYGNLGFPLGRDDSILASTLKQFATTMEEVSSVHTGQATQLNDLMVQPLASFSNNELNEINTLKELTRILDQEHENATSKYCRVSKKKENETKARIEANEELFQCRKKLLQNSLMYYNSMNMLQYKRTTGLLEPMLGFFQAQLSLFRMGKETLNKQTEEYLSDITTSVQSVHSEMGKLAQESSDKMQEIQENSVYYFMPEPTPDMQMQPRLVKTNLSQIAGYLMIRSKSGLSHRWERQYFFTQGGNLMSHAKGQIAGSLVIDLDRCTVNAADIDDRRFVFQVTRPEDTKKVVTVQCMSGSDREEWVTTIRNISSGFYVSERPPENGKPQPQGSDEVRSRTLSAPPTAGSMTIPSSQGRGDSPSHSYTGGTRPKHPVSLSNVPQKQRAESIKSRERFHSSDTSQSSSQDIPPTPPPSPFDSLLSSTPIQFDMISPSEEQLPPVRYAPLPKDVHQRRLNPFGDSSSDSTPVQVSGVTDTVGFVQMYVLRFLGSMEVGRDKGLDVVMDTIRKIMAARAIHNVFKMTELNIVVTSNYIRLLDSAKQVIKAHHDIQDVSFWAAHQENKRLFAFISSTKTMGTRLQAQFMCHVFESDVMADEICQALRIAADIAFQSMLQQRTTAMAASQRQEKTPLSDSPNLVLAPTNNQPALHHNQPQTTPQLHNQPPQHTTPTGGFIPIHTIPTNDQVGSAYNTNKNNSVSPPCGALSPDNVSGLEGLHLGQRMEEKSNEKPLILDESEA
ncbi:DCC-interacting protein 13-alpha-like isoform X2 [Asterias rubens]|uniref:DCC-interacting protein 13-alpha-like isoform X2 n=1 Tax=Asterias rubens TaxID=7604 RepID=UPI0014551AD1|nr:DCC-interacting protein 13-alpha-like isoform X2 [Asterias rubens]